MGSRSYQLEVIRLREQLRKETARANAAENRARSLQDKLTITSEELEHLRGWKRKSDAGAAQLRRYLADEETVEEHRVTAWMDAGATWNGTDYDIPEGWPEGVSPEEYIADRLGLVRERWVPALEEPEPEPEKAAAVDLERLLGDAAALHEHVLRSADNDQRARVRRLNDGVQVRRKQDEAERRESDAALVED